MPANVIANNSECLNRIEEMRRSTVGLVHDLKNQLTCIGANLTMIEHLATDEMTAKYVENIKRQLVYADNFIDQTLRRSNGSENHQLFDLSILLDDAVSFLTSQTDKDIALRINFDEEEDYEILGSQALISNTLLNLCSNAKDAIEEKGLIEIELTRETVNVAGNFVMDIPVQGDYSVLTVRDTGRGIAPQVLSKIFRPFYTVKGSSKRGVGIGLPNVIQTVASHGGNLSVTSEVGVGTTFKLYFKAA